MANEYFFMSNTCGTKFHFFESSEFPIKDGANDVTKYLTFWRLFNVEGQENNPALTKVTCWQHNGQRNVTEFWILQRINLTTI
jgi:hypothetical protein